MSSQTKLDDHINDTPSNTPDPDIPLYETVYATLNDHRDQFPDNAWYVAVIRDQDRVHGMDKHIDRVLPAIAPPEELTTDFKAKKKNLDLRDVLSSATEIHSQAWEATQFESRYQNYLQCHATKTDTDCTCSATVDNSQAVHDRVRMILQMVEHRPVVLVDLTPTDRSSPRLVLQDFLAAQYESTTPP